MEWIKVNTCCNVLAKGKSYSWAQFFLFGIWHLWLHRNKRMFQPPQTPQNLFKIVESQVYKYWYCVLDHANPKLGFTFAVGRVKPPVNWVKLNTDGSAQGNPGLAEGGGLIRDCHGNWISGFARAIGLPSSIVAELWAIRDGLTRLCFLSLEVVEVEVDFLVAISLLSQTTHTNGELSFLIDDCRNLMKNIPQVRLKHYFREANWCADALAKFGTNMKNDFAVFESPPIIVSLLHSEKLGFTQDCICNIVVDTTQLVNILSSLPKKKK